MNTPKQQTVSPETIDEINDMLDWRVGTYLENGQILGKCNVVNGKHPEPATIPDARINKLHEKIDLSNKSILEMGCLEGVHTLGLSQFSNKVTAIDIRPSNVVKTLTRLALYGYYLPVIVQDAESISNEFGFFDLIFHCGVFYHLERPVEHLLSLGDMCNQLYLDTHITSDEKADREFSVSGQSFQAWTYREAGWGDPFSGKAGTSLWLTEESLIAALSMAGFKDIDVWRIKKERNGERISLLASK